APVGPARVATGGDPLVCRTAGSDVGYRVGCRHDLVPRRGLRVEADDHPYHTVTGLPACRSNSKSLRTDPPNAPATGTLPPPADPHPGTPTIRRRSRVRPGY